MISHPRPASTRRELRRCAERSHVPREAARDHLRILTVCTGNICRSPMAEVLLRSRLGDVAVRVHSAGTRALVGRAMTADAQQLAIANGATKPDVTDHRARWLLEPIAEDADLILAMTREHRTAAVELAPRLLRQAFTVREFSRLASSLADTDVQAAADSAGSASRARLAAVLALLSSQRGIVAPVPAADDDVIDPYRRERAVYELSATQLVPALDEVARVLRIVVSAQ